MPTAATPFDINVVWEKKTKKKGRPKYAQDALKIGPELEMEQIVEQGQIESFCELKVGDNLVSKMQVAVVVKDGVVQAIE